MSRSAQFIGLNEEANLFVSKLIPASSDNFTEYYGIEFPLGRWLDKQGNEYYEVEQMVHFSSGPVIFTCLRKNNLKILYKWDKNVMEKY